MGSEAITILLFIAAGLVATFWVSRLIALLLKMAVIGALAYLAYSHFFLN